MKTQLDPTMFMVTYTGKRFYMDERMKDNEVSIEDIAHALSHVCRFGGHCKVFYSVAQHSVLVSNLVPKEHALAALLHDASEAYVSDIVRPVKRQLPDYKTFENKVQDLIATHFKVDLDHHEVHKGDNLALYAEAMTLIGNVTDWDLDEFANDTIVVPLNSEAAKQLFIDRYEELTGLLCKTCPIG